VASLGLGLGESPAHGVSQYLPSAPGVYEKPDALIVGSPLYQPKAQNGKFRKYTRGLDTHLMGQIVTLWLCHGGIMDAAQKIYSQLADGLRALELLASLMGAGSNVPGHPIQIPEEFVDCRGYNLVTVGHSLGATAHRRHISIPPGCVQCFVHVLRHVLTPCPNIRRCGNGGATLDHAEAVHVHIRAQPRVQRGPAARQSEKGAKLAQRLGQLQPFLAVFPQEYVGQLASFGPT
jgi:hypothetical protein